MIYQTVLDWLKSNYDVLDCPKENSTPVLLIIMFGTSKHKVAMLHDDHITITVKGKDSVDIYYASPSFLNDTRTMLDNTEDLIDINVWCGLISVANSKT